MEFESIWGRILISKQNLTNIALYQVKLTDVKLTLIKFLISRIETQSISLVDTFRNYDVCSIFFWNFQLDLLK